MECSDEEGEILPDYVDEYYFVDKRDMPVEFCVLPVQWDEDDTADISALPVFLCGSTDRGDQSFCKLAKAWKFDLSEEHPKIQVLLHGTHCITLQKPTKSYESLIRTTLVTLECLHFVKRNPEASSDDVWNSLHKVDGIQPSEQDLSDHVSLLCQAMKADCDLTKSKCLPTFTSHTYPRTCRRASISAPEQLKNSAADRYTKGKSSIVVIGLSIHTAPVEMRKKLAIPEADWPRAIGELCGLNHIEEAAVLSTCNRMEIYVLALSQHRGVKEVTEWMSKTSGIPVSEICQHRFLLYNKDATQHIFEVSAGLDSLVLREDQILAQVQQVVKVGQGVNGFGRNISGLFKHAITVGKRVRTETNIAAGAVSVSSAAVGLALMKLPEYSSASARMLIIGAGKMGKLVIKHLVAKGCTRMVVVNRSEERVTAIREENPGVEIMYRPLDEMLASAAEADVVFTSTASETPLFLKEHAESLPPVCPEVGGKRLFVDISVPRNVGSCVNEVETARVYNVDDLKEVVAANKEDRLRKAMEAQTIIAEESNQFEAWRDPLETVPMIKKLRAYAEKIRMAELEKCLSKMGDDVNKKTTRAVDDFRRGIVNRFLHGPMQHLRCDGTSQATPIQVELPTHYQENPQQNFSVDNRTDKENSKSLCDKGDYILCCEGSCLRAFHATIADGIQDLFRQDFKGQHIGLRCQSPCHLILCLSLLSSAWIRGVKAKGQHDYEPKLSLPDGVLLVVVGLVSVATIIYASKCLLRTRAVDPLMPSLEDDKVHPQTPSSFKELKRLEKKNQKRKKKVEMEMDMEMEMPEEEKKLISPRKRKSWVPVGMEVGTVVEGTFKTRKVNVSCLVGSPEDNGVSILTRSDGHQNILRYYSSQYMEDENKSFYALDVWICTLTQLIQFWVEMSKSKTKAKEMYPWNSKVRKHNLWSTNGDPLPLIVNLIRDVICGLDHLHEMKIIHGDLTGDNIVIGTQRNSLVAKLSLHSRRAEGNVSGDLFSLGCVIFYILSKGKNPIFENNQLQNCSEIKSREALDLINSFLHPLAKTRPGQLIKHPFLWSPDDKLSFLEDVSDGLKKGFIEELENRANTAIGGTDWTSMLDPLHSSSYLRNPGFVASIRDLLRVIRNTRRHYKEQDPYMQNLLGTCPDGVSQYFTSRFPNLFMEVYEFIYENWKEGEAFRKFFQEGTLEDVKLEEEEEEEKKKDWDLIEVEVGTTVAAFYKRRPVRVRCFVPSPEIENQISILTKADDHANILRLYSSKEKQEKSIYCVEPWICTLTELVEKKKLSEVDLWTTDGHPLPVLVKLIREVVSAVDHLHDKQIIHRDLRPANIMIATKGNSLVAKVNDMGVAFDSADETLLKLSLESRAKHSREWRAPELDDEGMVETSQGDLFSLGCIIFYMLTGKHPRDNNLSELQNFPEAFHLIKGLLHQIPNHRPSAGEVLLHPFFWTEYHKLCFLVDAHDRLQTTSDLKTQVTSRRETAIGGDEWDSKLHTDHYIYISSPLNRGNYNYTSLIGLLELIRNTRCHYQEFPPKLKIIVGESLDKVYKYFSDRFPNLLMEVYDIIHQKCKEEVEFKKFFKPREGIL